MGNGHREIIEDELSLVDVYAGGHRRTLLVSDQPTSQLMGGTVGRRQQRDLLDTLPIFDWVRHPGGNYLGFFRSVFSN